ncbi:Duplicated homeodomain-like superfamily protein [Rhynchospora pubera]|uniref:Transcription factor MYBS1 n=1 Tax=Rhynchospora pubera TaxID=906938 RepID=A0AAV8EIN8_9POAL|nr:Duplicated homeodomain-like superfamily protein [Rhynchospora pubera]
MEEASSSNSGTCAGTWSREEEKAFENAVATHGDNWEEIAALVPSKTLDEIQRHYELLVEDIDGIEAGRVQLPPYSGALESGDHGDGGGGGGGKKGSHGDSGHGGKGSRSEQERRKGIAWTEDEHRLFLLGLDKYGKGDWRSISRNFVISRTPTQVASHAQKYFIRLNSMNKERRRSSIHDITSVTSASADLSSPITGQSAAAAATTNASSAKSSSKPPPQTPVPVPVPVPMYGTTIGQPVGPLGPAVGTPVTLPPHMGYGVHAPVAGTVVPGAPVAPVAPVVPPMTYPMPPTSHR